MKDDDMVRCPYCQSLVYLHPEDTEQYCIVCHHLFKNGNPPDELDTPAKKA